ncbi:MAG TPA: hypothetical protein VIV11_39135 [Kofleriaceae bacterium]
MTARALPLVVLALSACVDDQSELSPNDGFDDTMENGKTDGAASGVRVVHTFGDRRLFPEGGAFDPIDRAFYTGSLEHGSIMRVDANSSESTFFAGTGEPERYTLGMQVDAARRRLWVCTTLDSRGSLWIFDLATGERTDVIDLRAANAQASCNDVLLDGDTAFASDRENAHIYKVDADHRVSVWAHDPLLEGTLVSLNSMVFTPDRSALLTATYLEPALIRVSVANPRDVRKVKLSGDMFMDGFNLLNGPDDLVMHGSQLVVAFGSSIKRVTANDASWTTATVKSTRTIGGVTALVQDGTKLFGINGQSVRFLLGVPPAAFQIFEIDPARLR